MFCFSGLTNHNFHSRIKNVNSDRHVIMLPLCCCGFEGHVWFLCLAKCFHETGWYVPLQFEGSEDRVGEDFWRTIGEAGKEYSKELGTNVAVCRNEQFTDPVHDVPHNGPVFLCHVGMNFCFHLSRSLGYWCENVEETVVLDEEVRELQQKFQTVHPICFICKTDGKRPFTRHPLNFAKRPKH